MTLKSVSRAAVLLGLRQQVGLDPYKIQGANRDVLLALAKMGGMRPETRVFRWLEIARITIDQFGGDLSSILTKPYAEAKRALKQFPNIGDPGADKILLFAGIAPQPCLDSNGLRALVRLDVANLLSTDRGSSERNLRSVLRSQPSRLPESSDSFTGSSASSASGASALRESASPSRACALLR